MIQLPVALDIATQWCSSNPSNIKLHLAIESLIGHIHKLRTDDLIDLSAAAYIETSELIARLTQKPAHDNTV